MPLEPNVLKTFKFKWIDGEGNETGFLKKRGEFNGETLKLDYVEVLVDGIASIAVRDKFLAMVLPNLSDEEDSIDDPFQTLTIAVYGIGAEPLKRMINGARSDVVAANEKKQLDAKGLGHQFRSAQCPFCDATVLLSRLPETPQCYCDYCETLHTVDTGGGFGQTEGLSQKQESKFRICDECDMYSQPRKFTVFYFIFLIYFVSYSHRPTWRCPGCMRGDAWKMLFGNIFGLIGLPVAIVQLFRSYYSKASSGPLRGLDDANILARKGNVDKALSRYDGLMDNVPVNAGIKFNIGWGLVYQGDYPSAETMFKLSLDDCANYRPSIRGLIICLEEQQKEEELVQLYELHHRAVSRNLKLSSKNVT